MSVKKHHGRHDVARMQTVSPSPSKGAQLELSEENVAMISKESKSCDQRTGQIPGDADSESS